MKHCTNYSIRIPPNQDCLSVFCPHSLPDETFLLSLSLFPSCFQHRLLCRDLPLCLVTCCSTSVFFLDACLVRRSAICYRVSIHRISTSTSVARDLTMASSIASRGLLMKERLFPFAVSHQQHRLQRKLCRRRSTVFSSNPTVPCEMSCCMSQQPNCCAPPI